MSAGDEVETAYDAIAWIWSELARLRDERAALLMACRDAEIILRNLDQNGYLMRRESSQLDSLRATIEKVADREIATDGL